MTAMPKQATCNNNLHTSNENIIGTKVICQHHWPSSLFDLQRFLSNSNQDSHNPDINLIL